MDERISEQQPGALQAWRLLASLAPFQFVFGLIYSWGDIAPAIHLQAGWTHAILSLVFSFTPLALFPSIILAGRLLGRIAPKTMLAYALSLFTLGGAIGIGSGEPLPFILGYSILALGVGAGLSTAACIALVRKLHPTKQGVLGGALLALYGASSIVSAPAFDTLNEHLGWRLALASLFAVYTALGWLGWAGLPSQRSNARKRVSEHIPVLRLLKRHKLLWAVGGVLVAAPLGALSFAVIGQLVYEHGLGRAFTVEAVALMAFGNGLGRLGFGMLADLKGARFSRDVVLALNALAGLLLIFRIHDTDRNLLALYSLLIGLAYGGMAGKLPALASHVVEQRHADSAFGLLYGTFALASFLGPLLGSALGMQPTLMLFAASAVGIALLTLAGGSLRKT